MKTAVLCIATVLIASGCGSDDVDNPASKDAGNSTQDASADGTVDAQDAGVDASMIDADGATADADEDVESGADADVTACLAFSPEYLSIRVPAELSVQGMHFESGLAVHLTNTTSSEVISLGTATLANDAAASVTIAAFAVDPAEYTVSLETDAGVVDCPGRLTWIDEEPVLVTAVHASQAWQGDPSDGELADPWVDIEGSGFDQAPTARWIRTDDPSETYDAPLAFGVDAEHLRAVCPSESAGMATATYMLEVQNRNGLTGRWAIAQVPQDFIVTATPPPRITGVTPAQGVPTQDIALEVSGSDFVNGAVVQLVASDAVHDLATTYVNQGLVTATLPTSTVGVGVYPLRVRTPDERWGEYRGFMVKPASVNHQLDALGVSLIEARWRHGSQGAFDSEGNAYLYTVGGIDSSGTVLSSVEILPLDTFGVPGVARGAEQWDNAGQRVENALQHARHGHALTRAGRWLYALGGAGAFNPAGPVVNAESSVERAQVLGDDTRPRIESTAWTDTGALARGVWFYQVSALGAWGESLPSTARLAHNASGTVTLTWSAVPQATGYNVYRNLDPDGNGGATGLLSANVTGTSFADDGTKAVDVSVVPLPPGSLGRWQTSPNAMLQEREGLGAVVVVVPSGNVSVVDKVFLYAVGGRPNSSGTGYLASCERAEVLADGSVAAFSPLSSLPVARAFHVLLTNDEQSNPMLPSTAPSWPSTGSVASSPLMLMVAQGDDNHTEPTNLGTTSFMASPIHTPDGDIGAWTQQVEELSAIRTSLGHGALWNENRVTVFSGALQESSAVFPTPATWSATKFTADSASAEPARVLSDRLSTAISFTVPRSYYQTVRIHGYVWVVGGATETGPLAAIERAFQ